MFDCGLQVIVIQSKLIKLINPIVKFIDPTFKFRNPPLKFRNPALKFRHPCWFACVSKEIPHNNKGCVLFSRLARSLAQHVPHKHPSPASSGARAPRSPTPQVPDSALALALARPTGAGAPLLLEVRRHILPRLSPCRPPSSFHLPLRGPSSMVRWGRPHPRCYNP